MRFLGPCILPLALLGFSTATNAAPPKKPNIVFILADDLGLDGVSCYGSDVHRTPNIDRLAASGVRYETCYAAPLCGPSRCLLLTGRYAFRTGGLTNNSWNVRGEGAKSRDEWSIAKVLKQAGYVTGQAGKWRQVGETPGDWGFDEYCTDNTAGGWYWRSNYLQNGQTLDAGPGAYNPDIIQKFSVDFLRRHKDEPFFLYYPMHFVHGPIQRTPDSADGGRKVARHYDDNLAYMDKQVAAIVEEIEKLGLRKNTLIVFSGDNGTARGHPSTIGGRRISGQKASMLEGGSRVPFIASWPGTLPGARVSKDIVSFADLLPTFAELAGAKLPKGVTIDGHSYAPQLRGKRGKAREWAYVQLGQKWFVREPGWKMNESGELFDMSDAPFVEKFVASAADTRASHAARERLTAVLARLNPAGGKTSAAGAGKKKRRGRLKTAVVS